MLLAIIAVPIIIAELGEQRFAVLSIVWLFIGYFSFLDFGIGRATTKLIIESKSYSVKGDFLLMARTSIFVLAIFGIVLSIVLLVSTGYIIDKLIEVPGNLLEEGWICILIVSLTIPFVMALSAARGALEAERKFRLLTIIRIPSNILTYLVPILVLIFSDDLILIVFFLSLTRVATFLVHLYFVESFYDAKCSKIFESKHLRSLFKFGSWLTVSNLIGPIMVYFDRLLVGSYISLSQLAYYSTPFEVISKFTNIAGSSSAVLFPSFASLYHFDKDKMNTLYQQAYKWMLICILFLMAPIILFSNEILSLWINDDFSAESQYVMMFLSAGVYFNAIGTVPYIAIQAAGRPDITGKVHIIELPIYIVALWILTKNFGINGMAFAWALRNLLDVLVFTLLYTLKFARNSQLMAKQVFFAIVIPIFVFSTLIILSEQIYYIKIPVILCLLLIELSLFWFILLDRVERMKLFRTVFKTKNLNE